MKQKKSRRVFLFLADVTRPWTKGKKAPGPSRAFGSIQAPRPLLWVYSATFFFYIKHVLQAVEPCEIFISASLKFAARIRLDGNPESEGKPVVDLWIKQLRPAAQSLAKTCDIWTAGSVCLLSCTRWRPCDFLWLRNASRSRHFILTLHFRFASWRNLNEGHTPSIEDENFLSDFSVAYAGVENWVFLDSHSVLQGRTKTNMS